MLARILLSPIAFWLVAGAQALAALTPSIPEVRLMPAISGVSLEDGAVHALAGGRALAVWTSAIPGIGIGTAFGQIVGTDGRPDGSAFVLNAQTGLTPESLDRLVAAVAPDGSFLVAWQAQDPDDEDAHLIYARAYDAAAVPRSAEIAIDTDEGRDELAGVTADGSGRFVVSWSTDTGVSTEVRLRWIANDGSPLAPAVIVDSATEGIEQAGALAVTAAGDGIVVAWRRAVRVSPGGGDWDELGYMRSYGADGAPAGAPFVFDDPPVNGQIYRMSLGADDQDRLSAAWFVSDAAFGTWRARRLSLDGSALAELAIPSQQHFTLETTAAGELTAAWSELPADSIYQSFAQTYAVDGTLAEEPVALIDDLYLTSSFQGELADFDVNEAGSLWVLIAERRSGMSFQDVSGYFVRRICSGADATCKLCPDFDDDVDSDADGVPDGCDPCTNVGAGQDATRHSVMASFGGEEPDPLIIAVRDNRVAMRHRVVLPPSTSFATLPVEQTGVRLRIESAGGGAMVDVTLPGGVFGGTGTAGWMRKGSKIIYQDRTVMPANGFRRLILKDMGAAQPNLVSVQIKAAGGTYAVDASLLPLTAILTLGGSAQADAGVCSESRYILAECEAFGTLVRSTVVCSSR
ncbi:MAG TPA: hypothetical protein VEL28_21365 [Candidatus Binatia bacterium]|nr:hypothetical protein [Candidatus Binatia bacterium]